MRPLCLEFDDLCDATAHELEVLVGLKERCPELKVTLFTIPKRTSPRTIEQFRKHEWIKLAPHGWRHTRGECLSWTDEEAEEKILAAREMGIDYPVFRAPGWLLDGDVYVACKKLLYVVASHREYRLPHTEVPEYIYNMRLPGMRWYGAVHGHLTKTQVTGKTNYIGYMLKTGQLDFPAESKFILPHEAAKVVTE